MKLVSILRAGMFGLAVLLSSTAVPAHARPGVQIWTDRGARPVYREGSAMRVKVRASMDAYLQIGRAHV